MPDAERMQNFLHGLNASSEIVFDTATLIYATNTINVSELVTIIENKDNLLYFMEVNDGIGNHDFGMFLQIEVREYEEGS